MKDFLKKVDRNVLDPRTRLRPVTYAYMAVAVLLLLHHVYVTVYQKTVLTGARDLYIPFILFACASFLMGRLWKDKLFWVFAALLVLKVVRTAFVGEYALVYSVTYFVLSVYSFFICYAVSRVVPRELWKGFLSVLCFLWTAAALVYAAFGLKVAFTGVPIPNLGNEAFVVNSDHRLYLVYHAVTSGVILSVCMSMAVLGCVLAKNRILKGFYALAALVLFLTCSLTGTRTAFVMSGVNLALLLCIPLRDRLSPSFSEGRLRALGKHALLFLSVLVVTAGFALLQPFAAGLLPVSAAGAETGPVSEATGEAVPETAAEEAPEEGMDETGEGEEDSALYGINARGFSLSSEEYGLLNGRFDHWGFVLEAVFADPQLLFFGSSVYNTMTPVNELRVSRGLMPLYHCHNTFLQYLLENGIPGLLLYCAFVFTFLFHAYRVLVNRDLPFWQRALPVCAVICVLEGLIDNTCHVNFGYPQMTALYLFAGFTIALSREEKRKKADSAG